MKNIKILPLGLLAIIILLGSCKKFLNIVPDHVATINSAFATQLTAKKYLFTCYSYMPMQGDINQNPALAGGGEIVFNHAAINFTNIPNKIIARGNQNVVVPATNYWDGDGAVRSLFQGIRTCNIFLANIGKVHNIPNAKRTRWISEVKFLKAYYNFWLLRMYGPIPIVDKNLPITASKSEVRVHRQPIDSCVNYIINLLDTAASGLPNRVPTPSSQLGRITKPIALAVKALVLVTSASPLFNGNTDYANFKSSDGKLFFNQNYDSNKWIKAAHACKKVISLCRSLGDSLFRFTPSLTNPVQSASPETFTKLSIRGSVTQQWNSGIVWGNPNCNTTQLQVMSMPPNLAHLQHAYSYSVASVPLNIVQTFYTKNGLPINEDKTWYYAGRFNIKTAQYSDHFNLQPGYKTSALNFDRGPRFYADLGFDGGAWFGQGRNNDNSPWYIEAKEGQSQGTGSSGYGITGYWPKKLVNYTSNGLTNTYYSWPVIRLADLYLLYAECLNEIHGPTSETFKWIDSVRTRSGIPTIENAWTQYAIHPDKYKSKKGLRQIIHHEMLIEMAFEGKRFWELRRWKEAPNELNGYVRGWNIRAKEAVNYYQPQTLFLQSFSLKDYFWPIKQQDLIIDPNLVQNPGW